MGTDDNSNKDKLSYIKLNEDNNNNNNNINNNNNNNQSNNNELNNNNNNNNNNNDKVYTEIDIDSYNNQNNNNKNNNQNNNNNSNNNNNKGILNYIKSLFKSKPKRIIVNGVLIDQRSKEERRALKNSNGLKGIHSLNSSSSSSVISQNKFPDKPKYNDVMFSVLFFIQMVLFFVLLGISIDRYPGERIVIFQYMEQGLVSILISLPLILIFYLIWKRIFQIHPVNMIKTSFFFLLVILILCMALLIGNGFYICAVLVFIFEMCIIAYFINHRDKIPFAAQVISITLSVLEKYPSAIASSFISLFLTAIYWNLWLFAVCYHTINAYTFFGFLKVLFLYFNLYWTHYVITYLMYSTVSGLFAAFYFFANENYSNMPPSPCYSSFTRAITTSFGSIALGSLIVCIISTIEMLCRSVARLPVISFVLTLLANALCCFNRILYTFNIYSFSMVAIYGESYCKSSKKTFDLMINNPCKLTVAQNFLYITTLAISISMCFIIGFIVIMIMSAININEEWFRVQMFMVVFILWKPFDVIYSGVITLVMCLISEPRVLESNKPSLFYSLNQVYEFN